MTGCWKLAAPLLCLCCSVASADDCESISQATLKGLRQERWHTSNQLKAQGKTLLLELIRADGQIFTRTDGGAWEKSPMTVDAVIEQNEQMLSQHLLKLSGCRKAGSDTLPQGRADRYEYLSEAPGVKQTAAKVWIGSADGLPYRSESAQTASTTTYKNVTAPSLK